MAANPQTEPIDLGCESAENWQLPSTSTSPLLLLLDLGRLTLQLDELTTRLLRPESFHMWLNVSTAGKTARMLVNTCHT